MIQGLTSGSRWAIPQERLIMRDFACHCPSALELTLQAGRDALDHSNGPDKRPPCPLKAFPKSPCPCSHDRGHPSPAQPREEGEIRPSASSLGSNASRQPRGPRGTAHTPQGLVSSSPPQLSGQHSTSKNMFRKTCPFWKLCSGEQRRPVVPGFSCSHSGLAAGPAAEGMQEGGP